MSDCTFMDTSPPVRMFQVGIRLSDHFALAMASVPQGDPRFAYERLVLLDKRISEIAEDLDVPGYVERARRELSVFAGEPISDAVREALSNGYDYADRIQQINSIALDQVRRCVELWGGKEALKRLEALDSLPIQCSSTPGTAIQCSFDRNAQRIEVGVGFSETLLSECMLFEFALFHEYLSHAFPDWNEDEPEVSEAWLFALELEWFKYEYTALDTDLLVKVWEPRLKENRDPFRAAKWLLGRCDSRRCVPTFLLNLVGSWGKVGSGKRLNPQIRRELLASLIGIAMKVGLRSAGHLSAKQKNTLELADRILCSPCEAQSSPTWDLEQMHAALKREISKYALPI